jgi:hypothetical protein
MNLTASLWQENLQVVKKKEKGDEEGDEEP